LEDLLHYDDDLNKVWVLQKFLSTMNTIEAVEFLIEKMGKHKVNREFLDSMDKREKASNHRKHSNGDDFSGN
jgi:transcription termination factor Rho